MTVDKKKDEEVLPKEYEEILRIKKQRKNLRKKEVEEQELEDMLEDLDDDTYAILKKLK